MKKNRLPLWALAWFALLLLALVILLANQAAVDRLMTATGLEILLYPKGKYGQPELVQAPSPPVQTILLDPAPAQSPSTFVPESATTEVPQNTETEETPEPPLPSTPNTYRLYFLKLTPEGRLEPASFARELPAVATPLAATLKALLLGPTLQDKAQGALSLVPEGTKLLSVRLKGKTALVSFSEEFQRNTSGLEGLAGQLRQIVWTATQFESVEEVQFLINGQYVEFLGDGELSISNPFTRANVP